MSTEYFEITRRNLSYCTKVLQTTDNVSEYLVKIGFDAVPYEIVSNGDGHYELMEQLFSGKLLLLKFYNGIFIKWNTII